MPELPEVETIKLGLQSRIIGRTIQKVIVLNPQSFIGDPKLVHGKKILNIDRKAKVLIINLLGFDDRNDLKLENSTLKVEDRELKDQEPSSTINPQNATIHRLPTTVKLSLLFHLKMSGQIIYRGSQDFGGGHPTKDMTSDMPNKSTRVIFELDDGSKIFFNDQRKFGWVKLLATSAVEEDLFIKKLGPEPLEKGFSWQILKNNLLKHKSLPIKVAILDQTIVAGVGNIYACEACFEAGLPPEKRVKDLTDQDFQKIAEAIMKVLSLGIKHGGSSKTHYVDVSGQRGYFLDYAYVYSRTGQPCRKCSTPIKRVALAGRGTFYCEKCQK